MKRLVFTILCAIIFLTITGPIVYALPDIFEFDTYDYNDIFHIHSYHPATSNGVAVVLVPGGIVWSTIGYNAEHTKVFYNQLYNLLPPEKHLDYFPFINTLTDRGYIVLMPYSTDGWFSSIDSWERFLDFVIDITTTNTQISKTIFVAHSVGGMVTFSYFKDRIQPKINNVLFFNTPLVYNDSNSYYCGFIDCNKISQKSTFIFGRNDDSIMTSDYSRAICDSKLITQFDAINDCNAQKNPRIRIEVMDVTGYEHSPFADENNEKIALPIFFETQKIESNCNNRIDDDFDTLIDLVDKQDCCNKYRAADFDGLCHVECGASPECDGISPISSWCEGNLHKECGNIIKSSSSTCILSAKCAVGCPDWNGDSECNWKTPDTDCCSGCYYADINGDGKIDMRDIGFVARRFLVKQVDPLWDVNADIDHSGKVDMKDIAAVSKNFGASCSGQK